MPQNKFNPSDFKVIDPGFKPSDFESVDPKFKSTTQPVEEKGWLDTASNAMDTVFGGITNLNPVTKAADAFWSLFSKPSEEQLKETTKQSTAPTVAKSSNLTPEEFSNQLKAVVFDAEKKKNQTNDIIATYYADEKLKKLGYNKDSNTGLYNKNALYNPTKEDIGLLREDKKLTMSNYDKEINEINNFYNDKISFLSSSMMGSTSLVTSLPIIGDLFKTEAVRNAENERDSKIEELQKKQLALASLYDGVLNQKNNPENTEYEGTKVNIPLETSDITNPNDYLKNFSLSNQYLKNSNSVTQDKSIKFENVSNNINRGIELLYSNNPYLEEQKKIIYGHGLYDKEDDLALEQQQAYFVGTKEEIDFQQSQIDRYTQFKNSIDKKNQELLNQTKKGAILTPEGNKQLKDYSSLSSLIESNLKLRQERIKNLQKDISENSPAYMEFLAKEEELNKAAVLSPIPLSFGLALNSLKNIPYNVIKSQTNLINKLQDDDLGYNISNTLSISDISPKFSAQGYFGNYGLDEKKPIEEITAIQLTDDKGKLSFDLNIPALVYNSTKMVGESAVLGGTMLGVSKMFSPLYKSIGKIGVIPNAITDITLGSLAKEYGLKGAAYSGAFLGETLVGAVAPSVMLFQDEMIKSEMAKGLTFNQAWNTSLGLAAIEGLTERVFPEDMYLIKSLIGKGAIKNLKELSENAIYKKAITDVFEKTTKKKLTERAYEALFNPALRAGLKQGFKGMNQEALEEEAGLLAGDLFINRLGKSYKEDYQGEEFNAVNVINTYISTMATMLPTGVGMVRGGINEELQSVTSSKFMVGQNPLPYIQAAKKLYDDGAISKEEFDRRANLINQYSLINREVINNSLQKAVQENYTQDQFEKYKYDLFKSRTSIENLKTTLLEEPSEEGKIKIIENLEKANENYQNLLEGLYKTDEERVNSAKNNLNYYLSDNSLNKTSDISFIDNTINRLTEYQTNEKNESLKEQYGKKIESLKNRKEKILLEQAEAKKTSQEKADDNNKKGVLKLNTKSGEKDFQIGVNYQLSRTLENKKDGTVKFNYPEFKILQDNGDGTVKIAAKNKKGQDVIFDKSKEELSQYDIFSEEELKADPIKSFYLKNSDKKMKLKLTVQNKNKHKSFKGLSEVEGILSLEGNDIYLNFKDKNGVVQSVKLGPGDIFGYGKYREKKQGLLKPVGKMFKQTLLVGKTEGITEEDLVAFEQMTETELEEYEKTKTEEAEKYFQLQLESQRVRRRQYFLEYLENIRKPISKIEKNIEKVTQQLQKIKEAAPLLRQAAKVSNIAKGLKPIKGVLTKEEVEVLKTKSAYEISQVLIQKAKDIEKGVFPIIKELENDYNNLLNQKAQTEEELKDEIDFINGLIDEEYDFESTILDQLKEDRKELQKELERNNDLINNFKNIISNLRKIANAVPVAINNIYDFLENEEQSNFSTQQLQEMFDDLVSKISNLEEQNEKLQEKIDRYEDAYRFLKRKSKVVQAERDAKKLAEYKEEIFTSQNEHQSQSETLTPEEAEKAKKDAEFTLQPHISKTFVATTSENVFDKEGNVRDTKNDNNVLRLQRFLEKVEKVSDYVLLVITKDNAAQYGLQDIIFEEDGFTNDGKEQNTDIKVVFVKKKDGKYLFPDQNLVESETPNPNQVIYTSIKTTSLVNSEGKKRYHLAQGVTAEQEKDITLLYQNAHRSYRQSLIDLIKQNETIELPIKGISKGVEVEVGEKKQVSASQILPQGTDLSSRPLIVIPENPSKSTDKTGKVVFEGTNENVNMPLGIPLLSFGQHLKFLNSRKFTPQEIENLMNIIVFMYKQSLQNKGKLNKEVIKYLSKVLYWRNPDYVSKATNKKQTSSIGKYQIWYDNKTQSLKVGKNTAQIPFKFDTAEELLKLKAFLSEVHHNIDIVPLELNKTGGVLEPYTEIVSIDKKGNLETREWPSYQEYLLSDKNPKDGSPRIPILTVSQSSSTLPNQSRYVTFSNSSNDKVTDLIKESIAVPVNPTQKQAEKTTSVPNTATAITETTEDTSSDFVDIPNPEWGKIPPTKEGEVYRYTISEDNYVEFTFGDNRNPHVVFDSKNQPGAIQPKVKDLINGKIALPKGKLSKGKKGTVTKKVEAPAPTTTSKKGKVNFSTIKKEDPTENSAADIPSYEEFTGSEFPESEFPEPPPTGEMPTSLGVEFQTFDDDYRIAQNRKYVRENLEEAEKWFKERFPQIDFKIIVGLINGKAWGQTLNAAVILSNFAEEGTIYHEAFEVVYKHFLTKAQKQALLKEFRNRKGTFTDYQTGEKVSYSEASDFQIKEQLAEEYREYALTGKKWEGEYNKNGFFRKLWDIITNLFSNSNTVQEVFDKINNAAYKDKLPKIDNINSSEDAELYRLSLTNPLYLNDLLNSVTNIMFSKLYKANKNILEIFKNDFSLYESYAEVKAQLDSHFGGRKALDLIKGKTPSDFVKDNLNNESFEKIKTIFQESKSNLPARLNQEYPNPVDFLNKLYDLINSYEYINLNWEYLQEKHKDYLAKYKVELEELEVDQDEDDIETDNRSNWVEDISINAKENANTEIKLLIATLLEKEYRYREVNGIVLAPTIGTKVNSLYLNNLVDYNKTMISLLYNLADATNFEEMVENLKQLKITNPSIEGLLEKLKVDYPQNELTAYDISLRNKFIKSLNKMKATYNKLIISGENLDGNFLDINESESANVIKRKWLENIKTSNLIKVVNDKLVFDKTNLKTKQIVNVKDAINFLNELGFEFEIPLGLIQKEDESLILKSATDLYITLTKDDTEFVVADNAQTKVPLNTLSNVYIKYSGNLPEPQHLNIEGKPVYNILLHNFIGIVFKNFNRSKTLDEFFQRIPQLNNPYSRGSQILKSSQFFSPDGKRRDTIDLHIIDGTQSNNLATPSSKLSPVDKILQEFASNLQGIYHILTPADTKTEWAWRIGHFISQIQARDENFVLSKFKEYLKSEIELVQDFQENGSSIIYLNEINKETGKAKGEELRLFDGIINFDLGITPDKSADEIISENKNKIDEAITNYINSSTESTSNYMYSNGAIRNYKDVSGEGEKLVPDRYTIAFVPNTFIQDGLTEQEVEDLIKWNNINYQFNIFEQYKLLWGDPAQWKDITKRVKSFTSGRELSISGEKYFNDFHSKNSNTISVNEELIEIKPNILGYNIYDDNIRTLVYEDLDSVVSANANEIIEKHRESAAKILYEKPYSELTEAEAKDVNESIVPVTEGYEKINEADAQAWAFPQGYKQIKQRSDNWTEADEEQHVYDLSLMRKEVYEKYPNYRSKIYPNNEYGNRLKAIDEKIINNGNPYINRYQRILNGEKNVELPNLNVLKPISTAFKNSNPLTRDLDKMSIAPLTWNNVRNTNAEQFFIEHVLANTTYVKTQSANKSGTEKVTKLYNQDGSVNTKFEQENIDFKWFGIQVETSTQKDTSTLGTQLTKDATLNLMNEGVPVDYKGTEWDTFTEEEKLKQSKIYKLVRGNDNYLKYLKIAAKNEIFAEFGIKQTDKGFEFKNVANLYRFIQRELKNRNASENLRDALQINPRKGNEFILPFDLIVGGEKIEALMSSVIDKRILRPKMFGGQMPQISSALFEKFKRKFVIKNESTGKWENVQDITTLSKEQQAKAKLTSNELLFYTDENGKRVCEVYVPYFFKESLKEGKILDISQIDPELLYGVAFRIPTQEINSVEHIKIKGFLPVEYGNSIVVPSEITTKAGSDFDIDKLNIYLYNYRFDENGKPKKIVYDADTSSKAIEKRYNQKYRSIANFAKWFKSEAGYRAFRASEITTGSTYALNVPESSLLFDFIFNELSISNPNINIDKSYNDNLKKLEQLVQDEIELTPTFKEFSELPIELQNSKEALENKYVDNLRDILQLKENYLYLTTPNSAKLLQDQTKQIDALYKEDKKSKSLTRFLDRISNALERYAFQVGKDAVGIAAVNQASHAISQKIGLNYTVFDPNNFIDRIPFNFKLNKKVLPNGKIIYSLSSVYSQDHKVISQVLSGFINAYVDIAKDPYIIRINGGITSASAYLTAVRLGMPISTVVRWFNQPIIREYIALKEKNKSILSDASGSKMLPWEIVEQLKIKYGTLSLQKTDEYTDKELENYITEYVENDKDIDKTSEEFKMNQVNLLNQFRELEKISGELFNFYQGISYDTVRTASHESFRIKFAQTKKALNGLFGSFISKALNDTFVGAIFNAKLEYLQATRQFYLSENDYARVVLNPILVNIFNTVAKKADIEKAAMDVRRHFITYLLQTIEISHNNKKFILTDLIDDLILGDRNIVKRLKRVQKEQKSGNLDPNIFLKYLQGIVPTVLFKNKGDQTLINSTRLVSKPKDKLQQDLFTDAINQLNQSDSLNGFINDLILSQLLQSGVLITPLSFSEIIPNEIFQSISAQIKNYFENKNPTELLSNFEDSYLRNKWKDSIIVPVARKRNERSGTKYLKPIFGSFSTNFLVYPVTDEERNFMTIPIESKFKYVKIRTQKERLSEFEQMDKKAAGDFSNIETIQYKRFETINPETGLLDVPLVAEMGKKGLIYKVLFYPVDKWGNGIYGIEHYSENKPSKYFKPVSTVPNNYEKIKDAIEDTENQPTVRITQYWLSDFKSQVKQLEDVEEINLDEFEKDLLSLPQSMIVSQIKPTQPTVSTEVKGENISSKGSEFAKKLTNPGNDLTVEYKGKTFRNAEHAYQTWKSGEFDQAAFESKAFKPVGKKAANKATNYQTMVEILTAKLQQHPELIEGINERGGLAYIEQSTHNVTGDKFWESAGQNKFIQALAEAYQLIQPTTEVKPLEDFNNLSEYTNEEKKKILATFASKHGLSEQEALLDINKGLNEDKQGTIDNLNECF